MTSATGRLKTEIFEAEGRIREFILRTPLEYSEYLSGLTGGYVYLKLENQQITKSFKIRGALNKILSLTEKERSRGVITASTGNHGAAVAHALSNLNIDGSIFLPHTASSSKVETLRCLGAPLEFFGQECLETEVHARQLAEAQDKTFISPYNDLKVISGQGTIGLELAQQLKKIDSILIPVGGGGLIAGVASYLKASDNRTQVIGCQPLNSAVMYESIKAGRILDMESDPTLSDGTAGGMEPESITFSLCQKYVDDFILVSEAELRNAVRVLVGQHYLLVEGAGALSTACLIKERQRFEGQTIVLLVSGARISTDTLQSVLSGSEA